MKVLGLGLDQAVLERGTDTAKRAVEIGELVEKYQVLVPSKQAFATELSAKTWAQGTGGSCKITQLLKLWKLIGKIVHTEKYTLVTVQDIYFVAVMAWLVARKAEARLEVQVHGIEKNTWLRKLVARFVLTRAHQVRVVGKRLAEIVIKEYGVKQNCIFVQPIAAMVTDIFSAVPERPAIFFEPLAIVSVGRLAPVKNHKLQIEAVRILNKERNINAILRIVGNGSDLVGLKEYAREQEVEDKLIFVGQLGREELKQELLSAEIFLHTSMFEGWGLALLEAAAANLPIVTTDVGCIGEILEPGIEVEIATSAVDFANKIAGLVNNPDRAMNMAKAAQNKVRKLPDTTTTIQSIVNSWKILVV